MDKVLIIGATSDIARAIADIYAEEGAQLIFAGRDAEQLDVLRRHYDVKYNINAELLVLDAKTPKRHKKAYNKLENKPNVAICAMGYLDNVEDSLVNWDECESSLMANYVGCVSILNAVAEDFKERGGGVIAGISSVAGERGRQSNLIYGSAKAGFSTYLDGLRNRMRRQKVYVVTIKLGFVRTRMTENIKLPKKLTAEPELVAEKIRRAIRRKKNTVFILRRWRWVMFVIKHIPEFVFKRLRL